MSNELEISDRDGARIVRFTRPDVRNPLSVTVLDQLDEVLASCARDDHIRRLIFTGTDDVFASGADLREIAAVTPADAPAFARRGQELMAKISALSQLTIAAVNGYCFGGALDLAISCDTRIASPSA